MSLVENYLMPKAKKNEKEKMRFCDFNSFLS